MLGVELQNMEVMKMNPIEQVAEDTLEDDVNNEAVKKE